MPFKNGWRYILAGILLIGITAALFVATLNLTGMHHKIPTSSQTTITKGISQGKLKLAGTFSPATLPKSRKGKHPYFGGNAISPSNQQIIQRAITDTQAPRVSTGNGALSVTSNDQHPTGLLQSFDGVNALSDLHVTTYEIDPPDQGLCVSPSFVVEEVNLAITIYFHDGRTALPAISLNDFFGENPDENTFDPRCFFDPSSASWFSTLSAVDLDNRHSHLDLAVSTGVNPTAAWNVYRIDTTDTTDTTTAAHVEHPACPCFADNPRLAVDAFGVYVTQNEFGLKAPPVTFYGSQVYAISKSQLVALQPAPYFVHYSDLAIGGMAADALQPALNETNQPAEFFMSSLYRGLATSHRISIWALTNQALLDNNGIPPLSSILLTSEVYGHPPMALQKGFAAPINTDDDRMDDVVYAGGILWGSLYSEVHVVGDTVNRSGTAWFAVRPQIDHNILSSAHIQDQGYIAVKGEYLLSGTLTVNKGAGAMIMTLVGPDYFPSVAYTTFTTDANGKATNFSPLHLVAAGSEPDKYGSCLPQYGDACSWGDYSATAIDNLDGSIWLATEYIPGGFATRYENWGTRILQITPS